MRFLSFWGVAIAVGEGQHPSPLDKERSYKLIFPDNQSSNLHPHEEINHKNLLNSDFDMSQYITPC